MDRTLQRITPDDASTGVPTATSLGCFPWYDGNTDTTYRTVNAAPAPTTTTCTVSGASPGWTVNEFVGRNITFCNTSPVAGLGFSAVRTITANTANSVTFAALPSAPTAGQVFWVGRGRFTDYHPSAGYIDASEVGTPSSRGGSSWQTAGNGVGPDATLVRYLLSNVYTTSPYFALAKYADPSGPNAGWCDAFPGSRANLVKEKTRIDAAATARNWVIDWKFVVIDLSPEDLLAAAGTPTYVVTYETALREMITWIKSQFSSSIQVVLVSHRDDLLATTSTYGAPFYRAAHRAIVANTAGVAIADCYDAEPGQPAGGALDPGVEITYYSQQSYFEMGRRIGVQIGRLKAGYNPAATTPAVGYPLYVMLGDSIFAGEASAAWVTALNSPTISGPNSPSLIRPSNQKVWNAQTQTLEVYQPGVNSNTSAAVNANAGPELSIMAYLGTLHPDGFALVKRASYSSALATQSVVYSGGNGGRWIKAANQHYQALTTEVYAAIRSINSTLGKQADVRGIFVSLGHNDQYAGGGDEFEAALRAFVADITADIGTRTGGHVAPILWRQPQDDAAGVVAAEVAAVRAALAAVASENSQFVVVDCDDLERLRTDNLHETPESSVADGYRMTAALATVSI